MWECREMFQRGVVSLLVPPAVAQLRDVTTCIYLQCISLNWYLCWLTKHPQTRFPTAPCSDSLISSWILTKRQRWAQPSPQNSNLHLLDKSAPKHPLDISPSVLSIQSFLVHVFFPPPPSPSPPHLQMRFNKSVCDRTVENSLSPLWQTHQKCS